MTRLVVSIIVPVYNDPGGVQTTLESLVGQRYDEYEILPVDNDSADHTPDTISSIASEHPDLISPGKEANVQSSYAARNTGIEHASGDVLLFLDADMWVPEIWIEDMVTALERRDCDYLGCTVEVVAENDPPNVWERYERMLSFPIESYLEHKQFAPTCALAVRREVFEEVGPFDERLVSGGDKEFGQRVHRAGFDQCYEGSITAYHPARDSLGQLLSKARRIGRGRAQMRQYRPDVGGYAHPFHLMWVLPPSPWRLRRRTGDGSASLPSMLVFYVLEYVLKLVQTTSALRETIAIRRNGGE